MKKYIFLLLISITLLSCARIGSPVGGTKDSLAPVMLGSNIDTTRVNVSRNIKQLRLDFNEYITLKEVQKNLIISPPIKYKRILPSTLGNKYILVEWEEELQENTTYNFNFGNAIADLNEGNILPYYNFAFSTGSELDQLYLSGEIRSGFTRVKEDAVAKKNGFVVGLYKASDSINYTQKPYYIGKADDDGYFELNYLSPGKYKLIAFDDTDENSVFTPGKDDVYFQKEDLNIEKSISGMKINLFPSKKAVRLLENSEIAGGLMFKFEGKPEKVEMTSQTEKLKDYQVIHKKYSDSVFVYFDDKQLELPETNKNEQLKFSYVADTLKGNTSWYYKANVKNDFKLSNPTGASIPPTGTFLVESTRSITAIHPDKWVLKVDSLNTQPFTASILESNNHKIAIKSDFVHGKKYALTIPKESVETYFEKLPVSFQFNFEADKVENYGSLTIKMKSRPTAKFWAQLVTEGDEVKSNQLVDSSEFKFSMVKPGRYYVRILVDNNGNGVWDEADFSKYQLAEDVYIYNKIIEIRALWDNVEDQWDPIPKEEVAAPEIETVKNEQKAN